MKQHRISVRIWIQRDGQYRRMLWRCTLSNSLAGVHAKYGVFPPVWTQQSFDFGTVAVA